MPLPISLVRPTVYLDKFRKESFNRKNDQYAIEYKYDPFVDQIELEAIYERSESDIDKFIDRTNSFVETDLGEFRRAVRSAERLGPEFDIGT